MTARLPLYASILASLVGCEPVFGVVEGEEPLLRADTGTSEASACRADADVEFTGQPATVLPKLTGLRESTGATANGSPVEVAFEIDLPFEQSWWDRAERDGQCWAMLSVQPDTLDLTVGSGFVTSGEQVSVFTPNGLPLLVVELEASASLVGGEPSDAVFIEISRSPSTERGTIKSATGKELVRW